MPLKDWDGEESHRPKTVSGSPFLVNRNGRAFKKTKYYYVFVFTVTQSVVTRLKSTLKKKRTKDLLLVLEVCLLRYH